jgi:hypothetical protein
MERKRSSGITYFFKPSSTKLSMVPCLHLWDPQIAEHFKEDSAFRRVQPKPLFQQKRLKRDSDLCYENGHGNWHTYKGWAKCHPLNAKKLEDDSKRIARSVYVPHSQEIKIKKICLKDLKLQIVSAALKYY